jgi:GNAT superfamily N-acetyltransferase
MNWYRKAQDKESINKEIDSLVKSLEAQYPGLELWVYFASGNFIELGQIRLPPEMQDKGIGHKVVKAIQEFAQRLGVPVVLRPEADPGKKKKLFDFYKELGFVHNKGRNRDYRLSTPFAPTMHWKPEGKVP